MAGVPRGFAEPLHSDDTIAPPPAGAEAVARFVKAVKPPTLELAPRVMLQHLPMVRPPPRLRATALVQRGQLERPAAGLAESE